MVADVRHPLDDMTAAERKAWQHGHECGYDVGNSSGVIWTLIAVGALAGAFALGAWLF